MAPPHVAIDGRLWAAYWTGTSSYLRGIGRALWARTSGYRYSLLTGGDGRGQPVTEDDDVDETVFDPPHLMDEMWEQVSFPTYLASKGTDALFAPGGVIPLAREFAAIPVIHDLGFLHHPEYYEPRLGEYLARWVEVSCRTAEMVICNSGFTRRAVMEEYGVPQARCRTVPPAPGPGFSQEGPEDEPKAIKEEFGLQTPYLLAVSSGGRNKNLPGLLEAFQLLIESHPDLPHVLAVVGPPGSVREEAGQRGVETRVRAVGRVPAGWLAALYRCAEAFVFPSLYEGFGLPPLEAMACGCPVVTSDRAALPETVGEAALLCDPADAEQMCELLANLAEDPDLRNEMAGRGLERAGGYTWDRSAALVERVFEEVLGD